MVTPIEHYNSTIATHVLFHWDDEFITPCSVCLTFVTSVCALTNSVLYTVHTLTMIPMTL